MTDWSSNLPTKGDTYDAPAFDARTACAAEKTSVTFTLIPSRASALHAVRPSGERGTLIVVGLMLSILL